MKKVTVAAGLTAAAAVVLIPLTLVQVTSAGATVKRQQAQSGTITMQDWLYAVPSENVLGGTVWDCVKITGAINDESGEPTWTDEASYNAPNTMTSGGVTAASHECGDKQPAGGFILVPPPVPGQYQFAQYSSTPNATSATQTGLTTLLADHTFAGQKGDIFMTFSGTYNFTDKPITVTLPSGSTVVVQPFTTGPDASFVITGGTGAYAGLQGSGTTFCNAQNTFPWINHTSHGTVWWTKA
jgi:hypothetical protein